ncbi:MAG TPA: RNA polymerase factor sigma-54 [Gemmatimonadota bacterium]|nr:RNA polymerase factor sigma-54 [Gemmatimonadota bacterium]
MALRQQLNIAQKQELRMNPRLYQAMDLLYLPLMELEQHLKLELTANPFLEIQEMEEEYAEQEEVEEKVEEKEDEIDWEEILLDGFDSGYRTASTRESPGEEFERVAETTLDLWDNLLEQLYQDPVFDDLDLRRIGEEIIGNIDEDGYLTCGVEEIAESCSATPGEVGAVLERVQRFEPPGVGARDLRECLLLQIADRIGRDSLAFRIVEEHFDALSTHKYHDVARAMGISAYEVQEAADQVGQMDPKPGLKYAELPTRYVTPDILVDRVDGEWVVHLNDGDLPRLRISRTYEALARNGEFKGQAKEFAQNKLNGANWIIQAIEQRRQTMLKTMHVILDRQREFFEQGIQHLRPLTLKEVADEIGMHESTISRVTNEKWAQTPRGVFRLKFFFSSGLSTEDGEDVSARGVKARIREMVDAEDHKKPLTDQQIVEALKSEGVNIARRTVQKYRDQLGILSSRYRKRV